MNAMPMQFPAGAPPQRNWFGRNWKWFVPVLLVAFLIIIAAAVAGFVAMIAGSMRTLEPYKHAVVAASIDQRVLDALGAPVNPRWYVSGSFSVSGASGEASLEIPVQGKNRNGTIYVEATKKAGEWSYQKLEMEIEGQSERIYFLKPGRGHSGEY